MSVKQIARILIILLAAGIVSGIAYALVQSGLVAAAGPGLGRERDFAGFMAEGRLPGRGELGQPPAALQGRFPEGGAFDRAEPVESAEGRQPARRPAERRMRSELSHKAAPLHRDLNRRRLNSARARSLRPLPPPP